MRDMMPNKNLITDPVTGSTVKRKGSTGLRSMALSLTLSVDELGRVEPVNRQTTPAWATSLRRPRP
jgi:hypothetical protein